jgi:hypothetical protein
VAIFAKATGSPLEAGGNQETSKLVLFHADVQQVKQNETKILYILLKISML